MFCDAISIPIFQVGLDFIANSVAPNPHWFSLTSLVFRSQSVFRPAELIPDLCLKVDG